MYNEGSFGNIAFGTNGELLPIPVLTPVWAGLDLRAIMTNGEWTEYGLGPPRFLRLVTLGMFGDDESIKGIRKLLLYLLTTKRKGS